MKILLLGEFSGLHTNLKHGLINLNHDVKTISQGDGFKSIEGDININVLNNNISYVNRLIYFMKLLENIRGYDVIHIINSEIFDIFKNFDIDTCNMLQKILNKLKKNNKLIYLSACGEDYYYAKVTNKYRYSPFDENPRYEHYITEFKKNQVDEVIKHSTGIIPVAYDYAEAYRNFKNTKLTIPLSIDTTKVKYKKNIAKDKIVIFHGLNRQIPKGMKYIVEAMEIVKSKYPDKVDIIIDGEMPLQKYLKVIEATNIIIDQCKSYGYGMNALYSMAQGKVVFSGCEKECLEEFNLEECPVVNITPNVEDIVGKLEYFIKNKDKIEEVGLKSRKFVEEFHDSIVIAKQYLRLWESDLEIYNRKYMYFKI